MNNLTLSLFAAGLICSLSALITIFLFVNKNLLPMTHTLTMVLILLVSLGADILMNAILQKIHTESALLHVYACINIALLGVAISGGMLVSHIIKKPSYVIPLAAAAGLADLWSVSVGVTHEIIQSKTAMNHLLLTFPVSGKGVVPLVGVTDFLFAVMFLSLSNRFDMPTIRTRIILPASFIISISIAVFGGFGVPVLPVMGGLFILGHYRYVKITDSKDKRDALMGIFIIASVLAIITIANRF